MNIFITGGSRGIGRGLVLFALSKGWGVAFTYASNKDAADEVLMEARNRYPSLQCFAKQLNVSNSDDVDCVVDDVLDALGTVDAVVNNAGITRNELCFSMTNEEWHDVINTNLSGAFYVTRKFLPAFLSNGGGRFVYLSSIARKGIPGQVNYCASKAGIVGMSACIAKEYGAKNIVSNVVVPGLFDTDMTKYQMNDDLKDYWMTHCPLKRMGKLDEIAEVIFFLASGASSFINGQVIPVTGGLDGAS